MGLRVTGRQTRSNGRTLLSVSATVGEASSVGARSRMTGDRSIRSRPRATTMPEPRRGVSGPRSASETGHPARWRSRVCSLPGRRCESWGVQNVRSGATWGRRDLLPCLNPQSVLEAVGFNQSRQAVSANLQQSQRDLNELHVFSEFSKRSPLNVDEGSIEKRWPPRSPAY